MEVKKSIVQDTVNYVFEKISRQLNVYTRYSLTLDLEGMNTAKKTYSLWENLRRKVTSTQLS